MYDLCRQKKLEVCPPSLSVCALALRSGTLHPAYGFAEFRIIVSMLKTPRTWPCAAPSRHPPPPWATAPRRAVLSWPSRLQTRESWQIAAGGDASRHGEAHAGAVDRTQGDDDGKPSSSRPDAGIAHEERAQHDSETLTDVPSPAAASYSGAAHGSVPEETCGVGAAGSIDAQSAMLADALSVAKPTWIDVAKDSDFYK